MLKHFYAKLGFRLRYSFYLAKWASMRRARRMVFVFPFFPIFIPARQFVQIKMNIGNSFGVDFEARHRTLGEIRKMVAASKK